MARARPRPRAPFVVTIALTAAAGACGGSTSSDSGSGGGGSGGSGGAPGGGGCGANPPSIPCPPTPPAEGAACPEEPSSCFGGWWGSSCTYPDPCGGSTPLILDCGGSTTWKVTSGVTTCATCPSTEPVVGAFCALPETQICSFPNGCCEAAYQCSQGKWVEVPVSCNPPPLICPATPPDPAAPCDPCALGGECSYDTCPTLGKMTKASCVAGSWSVTGAPCLADAGTD